LIAARQYKEKVEKRTKKERKEKKKKEKDSLFVLVCLDLFIHCLGDPPRGNWRHGI
jgi:hypothetical protein